MTSMTTLTGQILQTDPSGHAKLCPGVVEIAEEQIVRVDFGYVSEKADIGCQDTLICPGFIDTHLHLPQFDAIGAVGMKLLPWLREVIFPAETQWNDFARAEKMIPRVVEQCLSVGTTGICAYATVAHEATLASLMAFRDAGFRGVIGQVMMDQGAPAALIRPVKQLVDEVDRTLSLFPPKGRMAAAVTPRFALTCSASLMESAGRLAEAHQAIVQTHLAETTGECEAVRTRFPGKDYVAVYADAGLIGPRSVFGHGIHLDAASQIRLAESKAIIAHCPTANSFLGSGIMDRHSHRSYGIPITLGSDIGAGFERSMVRVGRAMIEAATQIARRQDEDVAQRQTIPTAAEAWYQITTGNADALGWRDSGRIETGASADLLVIRPNVPWRQAPDPLSMLMYAWDDRWISQTILRGRIGYAFDSNSSRGRAVHPASERPVP